MIDNVIYCGDCLDVLRKDVQKESVDLVYLDPPFFSNKKYEIIWGNGAELRAFEDRWKGGINQYVEWMAGRIVQCREVLRETGSIYLHCDWHASHYLKEIMDRIFGYDKFKREIIWSTEETSGFKSQAKNWIRSHDTILFYTKTDDFTFNKQFIPHKEEYIKRFKKIDEHGRRYRDDRTGGRRQYLDETEGKVMGDVWNDVMSFQQASTSSEYLGYPTQKPEALLERIILASSNPGDTVLDPFCGCGTTIAVAHKLERKWIGIDVSPTACKVMRERMREIDGNLDSYILPPTEEELGYMDNFFFQEYVIAKLGGRISERKSGDMGIDGYDALRVPIQVKKSHKVGRNVVDNFETAVNRRGANKGILVGLSFTRSAYEEVARVKRDSGLDICLCTLDEIVR